MSFQDVCHDLETGLPLPPRPPPPPPRAVVAHCVFQINTKVSELRRLAYDLSACAGGGGGDARVVRERIRRARADVTRLARNTARRLADPAAAADVGPNLATDLQAALREFQWVECRIIEADRQETAAAAARRAMFPPPSQPSYGSPTRSSQLNNANATAGAADQQCNVQMQQQQQLVESRRTQELALLDNEITFNEALVEEREREIRKIQQEIAEINEIFVELAKLVHDQQGAIDVVETNVEKAAMETGKSEEQLTRAALTHETNSSMKCLLITVLGLVMFIFANVGARFDFSIFAGWPSTPEAEGETRSTLGLGGGAPSCAPCLPVPASLLPSLYAGSHRGVGRGEGERPPGQPRHRASDPRRRQKAAVASPANLEDHIVIRLPAEIYSLSSPNLNPRVGSATGASVNWGHTAPLLPIYTEVTRCGEGRLRPPTPAFFLPLLFNTSQHPFILNLGGGDLAEEHRAHQTRVQERDMAPAPYSTLSRRWCSSVMRWRWRSRTTLWSGSALQPARGTSSRRAAAGDPFVALRELAEELDGGGGGDDVVVLQRVEESEQPPRCARGALGEEARAARGNEDGGERVEEDDQELLRDGAVPFHCAARDGVGSGNHESSLSQPAPAAALARSYLPHRARPTELNAGTWGEKRSAYRL